MWLGGTWEIAVCDWVGRGGLQRVMGDCTCSPTWTRMDINRCGYVHTHGHGHTQKHGHMDMDGHTNMDRHPHAETWTHTDTHGHMVTDAHRNTKTHRVCLCCGWRGNSHGNQPQSPGVGVGGWVSCPEYGPVYIFGHRVHRGHRDIPTWTHSCTHSAGTVKPRATHQEAHTGVHRGPQTGYICTASPSFRLAEVTASHGAQAAAWVSRPRTRLPGCSGASRHRSPYCCVYTTAVTPASITPSPGDECTHGRRRRPRAQRQWGPVPS